MENKRAVGSRYEEETAAFLQKNGYRILEKNFRDRRGEIDLIAKDGRTLVFVEVKYRKMREMAIRKRQWTPENRKRSVRPLQYYVYKNGSGIYPLRFDVVAVLDGEFKLINGCFL